LGDDMPFKAKSKATLAYMAGLVDGEGCIALFEYWHKNPKAIDPRGYLRHKAVISVVNTNRAMLDWVAENFGGRVRQNTYRAPPCKQCYTWEVAHRHAAEVIEAIQPYLIAKKEQANLFLEFRKTGQHRGRAGLPDGILQERVELTKRCRNLNKRGVDALEGERSEGLH
jgi:hypothetical protein